MNLSGFRQRCPLSVQCQAGRATVHKAPPKQSKAASKSKAPKDKAIIPDLESVYGPAAKLPSRQLGPVRVETFQGKGRGVTATAAVIPGDVLMVSEPIGRVVRGPEGQCLTGVHLLPELSKPGVLSQEDRTRLLALYDGTQESAQRSITFDSLSPHRKATAAKESGKPAAKGFGSPSKPEAASLPAELTDNALAGVVQHNCWGIEHSELGICGERGEQSHSFVGLWPEFAMLNHSCVPNTIPVLIGDRLVVRAATHIPEGGEAFTSYLGTQGGQPVSERTRALQASYGFRCNCARCKAERAAPASVQQLLEDMHGWLANGDLVARVKTQLATQDPSLEAVRVQLKGHIQRLEQLMQQHQVEEMARVWLRSSAYGCYELLAVLDDSLNAQPDSPVASVDGSAQGSPQPAASKRSEDHRIPARLLPLIQVFAPGSDTHLYLALEQLTRCAAKYGREAPETEEAARACLFAHLTRVGPGVSDEKLQRIMLLRSQVDSYLGRINLPTPWAAPA